jgi:hypothetical protein
MTIYIFDQKFLIFLYFFKKFPGLPGIGSGLYRLGGSERVQNGSSPRRDFFEFFFAHTHSRPIDFNGSRVRSRSQIQWIGYDPRGLFLNTNSIEFEWVQSVEPKFLYNFF